MRVTLRDVAKAAGTSVASASATLHGSRGDTIRVGEATRDRIKEVAKQLGYVANPIAKSLATGKTRQIGLILPYANAFLDENPFCSGVMHGVMAAVVRRHYNLTLYTAVGQIHAESAGDLIDRRVDGLVLVIPPDGGRAIQRCEAMGIPYVSVLRPPAPNTWSVNADEFEGGRLAARHLLGLGHRMIGHLGGTQSIPTAAPRAEGFSQVLHEAGVEPDPELFVTGGYSTPGGYEAMKQLLARPANKIPSAVFAANDLSADGAMRAIREFGLNVPNDIAVVGYDDTWFAAMTQPPLTSVHMPISEMGEKATSMLIDRLEGAEPDSPQPVLPVSLTIRSSCGASAADHRSGGVAASPAPSMRN